jgi:V8-like Glu-specific endopeptidase
MSVVVCKTMITPSRLLLAFIAVSTSLSVACASPDGDDGDGAESSEDAVIRGEETFERPEIGMVWHRGLCTGTLVRPNVVLTAMHCGTGTPVDADVSSFEPGYVFEIRKSATDRHRFKVVRAESIAQPADFDGSQNWRAKDILLLKLETNVPAEIATPAKIAIEAAKVGTKVAVYGYGCTSRVTGDNGRRPGAGIKRTLDYWWTAQLEAGMGTRNLCPGDSGGPLLDIERNAVFGTTSGYIGGVNGVDKFGDVPAASAKLNALADRWAASAPSE